MVSALDSGASAPGSSPGRGHCVVFLVKTLNSHGASLHQVYKWVPANLMLVVTLRWGEQKYSQSLHATETGIASSGLMGHYWFVCRLYHYLLLLLVIGRFTEPSSCYITAALYCYQNVVINLCDVSRNMTGLASLESENEHFLVLRFTSLTYHVVCV